MQTDNELNEDGVDEHAQRAVTRFNRSSSAHEAWRNDAYTSYAFVAGDQLDDATKAMYQEKLRPIVAFNLTAKYIDSITGLQVNNRQDIRYIPRNMGDVGVNELANDIVGFFRDGCEASDEETDAFWDTLTVGMGWTETFMDYELDPDGMICTERRDPGQMRWDPDARKRNVRDAKWVQRIIPLLESEITDRWPDAELGGGDLVVDTFDDMTFPHDATRAPYYESGGGSDPGEAEQKFNILEMQEYEMETGFKVTTKFGERTFDKEQWGKFKKFLDNNNVEYQVLKQRRRVYYRQFQLGGELLERKLSPCQSGYTYKCITGKRDRNTNTWYGLTEVMKDPQLWVNKLLSQIMHSIDTNAKGGILAERTAFENPLQAERDWSSPDKIVWMEDGALSGQGGDKFKERPQTTYPQGSDRLLQIAMEAFSAVTGIPVELLGMVDRNQPGVLEQQRKQAGMTQVAWAFDSMSSYLRDVGEIYIEYVREYVPENRLVRISDEEGKQKYIPLLKDKLAAKYDIIVDESPTSTNVKERTFAVLMQLMPQLAKMGIQPPPDFLDYTPLPMSMVQKWKESMKPDPQKQKAQQLQMKGVELEVQAKEKEIAENVVDILLKREKVEETKANTVLKEQQAHKAAAEAGAKM